MEGKQKSQLGSETTETYWLCSRTWCEQKDESRVSWPKLLVANWLNEAAKSPRLECPLQHQPGSVFVSRFEVEIEAFVVLRKTRELRMSSSQIGADDACFDFKTRGWARPTAVALSGALETSIRSCRQGGREGRSTNAYILFFKWSTRWCAEVLSCGC